MMASKVAQHSARTRAEWPVQQQQHGEQREGQGREHGAPARSSVQKPLFHASTEFFTGGPFDKDMLLHPGYFGHILSQDASPSLSLPPSSVPPAGRAQPGTFVLSAGHSGGAPDHERLHPGDTKSAQSDSH